MNTLEKLICKYDNCNKIYKNPIVLPCGDTICSFHVSSNLNESFICKFCDETHYIPERGFPLNKILLEILISDKYLDDDQIKAKQLITKLDSLINQLNLMSKDPERYLFDHFSAIKNEIDLERESTKLKIEAIYNGFINQINEFEETCKENLKNVESLTDLAEQNNKSLSNLKQDFNINEVDSRLLEDLDRCIKFISTKIESYKGELLANKTCIYESKKCELNAETFGVLKIIGACQLSDKFGICQRLFYGHKHVVKAILPFENINLLVSISLDMSIKIWDLKLGVCLNSLEQESELYSLCRLSDTKFLTGSLMGFIKTWDLSENTKCLNSFKELNPVMCLCILPDNRLAISVIDHYVIIRDLIDFKFITEFKSNKKALDLKIYQDCLAVSTNRGVIELWNIENFTCTRRLKLNKIVWIDSIDVSFDGNYLYCSTTDGCIKTWDIKMEDFIDEINIERQIRSIKLIRKDLLAIGLNEKHNNLIIYDLVKKEIFKKISAHIHSINRIQLLSDGNFLSCSTDRQIKMWCF